MLAFLSVGISPLSSDFWYINDSTGVMTSAACFGNVMGILFGPLAVFSFQCIMLFLTPAFEMTRLFIRVYGKGPFSGMLK